MTTSKITAQSLKSIPTSFATVSVGTPSDDLEPKLKAISSANFQAIELGFPDLVTFASKHCGHEIKENDYDSLCTAASEVKKLCEKYALKIMMLQPFSNFEGWPKGSTEREDTFERARGWVRIMEACGTDMLQVGSSDSEGILGDIEVLAGDLGELADMLAPKGFRIAYENWCWATHAPTWVDVWNIVQKANRPNLGLCLDTFQTAGGEYADPTTSSGLIENFGPLQKLEMNFRHSCSLLSQTVPADKIYLLQISDAYKSAVPFKNETIDGLRPRGRWSRDYRPCPFKGGYLSNQCVEFAKAVLKTGVRDGCYFSVEVFDGGSKGGETRERDFEKFTKGAMGSLERLLEECADEEVGGEEALYQ